MELGKDFFLVKELGIFLVDMGVRYLGLRGRKIWERTLFCVREQAPKTQWQWSGQREG